MDERVGRPERSSETLDPSGLVTEILDAWPVVAGPRTFRPTGAGLNNLSHFVGTPAGSFFLRVYQNTADVERVRYEHALLAQLRDADLPFATPSPLPTRRGETFVVAEDGSKSVVAALFPGSPGRHPEPGDVAQAAACGEALGELDDALARIEQDPGLPALGTFGDLHHVHPSVPDPLSAVERLPVPDAGTRRLRSLFEETLARVPGLYRRLPWQIIHSDLFRGNVLMVGDRVSGLLDFEFASPDLRAMDFAIGVFAFGVSARETVDVWTLVEAFAAGYGRRVALTLDEVRELPDLVRLREVTALVHWIGRLHQGLSTEGEIVRRAGDMMDLDDWLRVYGERLIRLAARACASPDDDPGSTEDDG